MRRAIPCLAFCVIMLLWPMTALAQGSIVQPIYKVVATCGSASYTAGQLNYPTVDLLGNQCSNTSGGGTTGSNVNLTGINGTAPGSSNPLYVAFPSAGGGIVTSQSQIYVGGAFANHYGVTENGTNVAYFDTQSTGSTLLSAINSGVLTPASPVPATALYMGLNNGGNGIGWTGDASGYGNVNVKNTPSVTGTVTAQFSTGNAATTPHICGSHVFKHITSATDTQIVAASGSTNIYICDIEFSASGALNFYLEKATSGTCATLTQIDMLWTLAANSAKTAANPYYRGLNTGGGAQLCVNTSAGNLDISVFFDQY